MFLWFGEEEHCKHMDSHHRDRSKCSLCVHFVKCVDHHQAVDHHKDYSMRDFAVGCGIGLLVSLTVPSKFVCLFIIFALLILSGDIETNPGPPCKFLLFTTYSVYL